MSGSSQRNLEEQILHRLIQSDLAVLLGDPVNAEVQQSMDSSDSSVRLSENSPRFRSFDPTDLLATNVCEVQFRWVTRYYFLSETLKNTDVGEFIVVQSFVDKSMVDLGVVTEVYSYNAFVGKQQTLGYSDEPEDNKVGKALRLARADERALLPAKLHREQSMYKRCVLLAVQMAMPLTIYGVEYQIDGHVLFVYFLSKERVDYRAFVRQLRQSVGLDLRVTMKRANQAREFLPLKWASDALATGDFAHQYL